MGEQPFRGKLWRRVLEMSARSVVFDLGIRQQDGCRWRREICRHYGRGYGDEEEHLGLRAWQLTFVEWSDFLDARKPVFGVCEEQRRTSACASAKTDQRLCYLLFRKCRTYTCYRQNFNFLATCSLCSWGDWGWSLALSETPKTGFVATWPNYIFVFGTPNFQESTITKLTTYTVLIF